MNAKTINPKRDLLPNGRLNPLILGFLLAAGGTAKTTSTIILGTILALRGYYVRIFDLDAQCTASEILNQGPKDLNEEQPTVYSLIRGLTTLEEVTVPARMWNGETPPDWDTTEDGPWKEYTDIPNLYLVPSDEEMKNVEKLMATEPDCFQWFWELVSRYRTGDLTAAENEVWLLDLPANYGQLTVSTLLGMDENDEVIPPVLVTSKEAGQLHKLMAELADVTERYRGRVFPARARVRNILMCGTPTASHDAVEYHRTIEEIESAYPELVLPKVRYSGVVTGQHRQRCPIPISDKKARPTEDYTKVADHLGFPDLVPGAAVNGDIAQERVGAEALSS